ncbi:baseplate wedge subunit [Acinetobacter phage vB_AbaM_Konradin]|uniref:Tail sheath polymerization initiator n=3 Tax=Lazarusvirus TaxID=2842820 RepID=A0A650EV24_9CAUD|nr:baseplate wedge subunit [Acinetobacter phage KARL-1]YP_009885376.1 baseplate wedge subunit [Acinetobacter phage vB_AbaM_Konradin]YP_009886466.1 baseplate wedge subunit [Acinetobacter phage vB_AbaM_Apostate]AXY82708.1 baseplate wedge subunit [Acinetobacter phage KARL-1]QGT53956.1 tail sheath polymerization initiator [Acinetobacter phage vB_AbaM_Konradin]QGZ15780.1 tail sheath polymerization initiator [Acinetobacter phage vB_AbaM_Apostate]
MQNINDMYTDISPEMARAWNKDVAASVGARAVKNSLLGIITTPKGSRPFDPEFGCEIGDALFENMSPLTVSTVEKSITSAIRAYEPRIVRLSVSVQAQYDNNAIIVTVMFSILDNPDTLEQLKLQLSGARHQ